jgi:hypothetical protein
VDQSHRGTAQPSMVLSVSFVDEDWQCWYSMHCFLKETLTIVLLADSSHSCHGGLAMGDRRMWEASDVLDAIL